MDTLHSISIRVSPVTAANPIGLADVVVFGATKLDAMEITCVGFDRSITLCVADARKLHRVLGEILNEHTTTDDKSGSGRPRRKVNPRAPRK